MDIFGSVTRITGPRSVVRQRRVEVPLESLVSREHLHGRLAAIQAGVHVEALERAFKADSAMHQHGSGHVAGAFVEEEVVAYESLEPLPFAR